MNQDDTTLKAQKLFFRKNLAFLTKKCVIIFFVENFKETFRTIYIA